MFLEFLLVLLSMHHGAREDMDFSTTWTLGLPVVQPLTSVSAIDPLGCGCCMKNTCRFTSRVRVCRKLCICSGQWFPRCLRCGEGGFVTSSIIFAPMQLGFFSFLFFLIWFYNFAQISQSDNSYRKRFLFSRNLQTPMASCRICFGWCTGDCYGLPHSSRGNPIL